MTHWHHFPAHDFSEAGAFMVTAGTYGRYRYFGSPERLTLLTDSLFGLAEDHGVQLQAWAVMANHYHFVALAPSDPQSVRPMIARLHAVTAKRINDEDESPGRKVWFQYWDSHITFQRSYYARLNYVHQNPVHHRLVPAASGYPWCSASWFETSAAPAFFRMISSFKIDQVKVIDAF